MRVKISGPYLTLMFPLLQIKIRLLLHHIGASNFVLKNFKKSVRYGLLLAEAMTIIAGLQIPSCVVQLGNDPRSSQPRSLNCAKVAELVDALVLGTSIVRCESSSLSFRTTSLLGAHVERAG